jgi:predicted RNase H-like HicB family nuclease
MPITSERRYSYTVVFEPAEEGGYTAHVPALPGLWTQGETLIEAREMVKDAIAGYIEALIKSGDAVPDDRSETEPIREILEVSIAV